MSIKVKAAITGPGGDPMPAPVWDYENGLKLTAGSSSDSVALSEGLWLLSADGGGVYYKIGDGEQTAANAAGNGYMADGASRGETVVGASQEIGFIRRGDADCTLWAIPALEG